MWISFIISSPLLCEFLLNRFIKLIPQISHQFDNPQRISSQNNSLTTVVEAVSSDVRELRVLRKGISQLMSPFGQLQPCVNFALDVSFPAIYDRMRIPHIGNV